MLEISIDINSLDPLYQQIVEQIKRLITSGLLKSGEQIPSVRELASWLQLNPSTVARAYYDLKLEGLVATSRRRGTIIIGNKDCTGKEAQIKNRFSWTGNNHRSGTLAQSSTLVDMETAFTLRPAHWRVQRTG